MTTAAHPRFKLPPAVSVVIILAALGTLLWFFTPILRIAGQWFVVIGVVLAFRYWPPMFTWVRGMPGVHRTVFSVLLAAMILGHLTLRHAEWYPFEDWKIFPMAEHAGDRTVHAREFIATTQSGREIRLITEQLFPSIIQIRRLDDFPPELASRLAQSLAREYNRRHPADPVREVKLVAVSIPLHPDAGAPFPPPWQLLQSYDVSSAPSN